MQIKNNNKTYNILYVGFFSKESPGELEVAESLRELGHSVRCIEESDANLPVLKRMLNQEKFDFILFAKFRVVDSDNNKEEFIKHCPIPCVCWVFDLYFGI